ncbi:hypothetical protein DEO72_LG6g1330 [Vigna unguiculata]|uniref:Uncharacterized protein n=1 Tax=Vigna unguiculata TaxID=3917 RepID=A0A4D6M727_VIGUN|nr:hypothetical protein DEO72_LG6g1330 [Vigna unguiculata]
MLLELLCSTVGCRSPLLAYFQVREVRVSRLEGSGFLVQVGISRLGEIYSNSPRLSTRAVAQATSSYFERESISLRRGGLA